MRKKSVLVALYLALNQVEAKVAGVQLKIKSRNRGYTHKQQ